ncbi:unnamed protein product, partial [Trichobilharzia regenti]
SACEFESNTSEKNSHEILSKANDPPVNPSNNTYWFRLHTNGYSEKDDFYQAENSTQNDYDNLDSIRTSPPPPPPPPPTSTSGQPVNSFVTNVFGSRLESCIYSSSQINNVTDSLSEFINSERECQQEHQQQQQQQHQHQTRRQQQSLQKLKDESKINQALKPIHVNTEIFNQSTSKVKSEKLFFDFVKQIFFYFCFVFCYVNCVFCFHNLELADVHPLLMVYT